MKDKIGLAAAKLLLDIKAVSINTDEPFTYTSGKRGPVYVDCRRPISFPEVRTKLMDFASEILKPLNVDYVAGGETAGIPYSAFIADRLNKPMLYIRKKPKGFGKMSQIEGHMEDGTPHVALIEDVQNFGVSVKVFVDALRAAGAKVEHLMVIFEYGHESSRQNMKDMGIELHSLTSWDYVLKVARDDKYFDDATIESVKSFLKNPDAWAEERGYAVPVKQA
jgi:orotate phosphoribosyltransferase